MPAAARSRDKESIPWSIHCLSTFLTFLHLSFLLCIMGLIIMLPGELSELIYVKASGQAAPSTLGFTAEGAL